MSAVSKQVSNFIGGEWVASVSGKWLQKTLLGDSPGLVDVADSDLMDVVRAVQASNKALPDWLKLPANEKSALLLKVADLIESRAHEFAQCLFEDLGTPLQASLEKSLPVAVGHFRAHAASPVNPAASPIGLIAAIFPASDPLVCFASRIAPALKQSNVMIAKSSRQTPQTAHLLSQVIHEAGVPAGVFNFLHGRGAEVGDALLRHPGVSTISFMGSTATGRSVAVAAAEAFKRLHLSLGAKNPVLVFANTDLAVVIPQVARLCLGCHPAQALKGSRLFIQESIFKSALDQLKAVIESADEVRLAKTADVQLYRDAVELALKENGKVVTTGRETPSKAEHFVKPYLFADLTNCSTLQQDEINGPLILATSFKYQHEALKHANVSPYGRIGYVFENDLEKAERVARKMEVGTVIINSEDVNRDPLEEISLLKNSGSGPEGGVAMMRFFSREMKVFI